MFNRGRFLKVLMTLIMCVSLLSPMTAFAAEDLLLPPTRSKDEIIQKWGELDKNRFTMQDPFIEKPLVKSPYKPGVLNEKYIEQGVKTSNFYRYLSGLPMNFTADAELNKLSQYGSVLLAKLRYLSHYPDKPADMPEDFYEKGYKSAGSSNLAMAGGYGKDNILSYTVDLYMGDIGVSSTGHRSWILSPNVSKIGFGLAFGERNVAYSAMNVISPSDYWTSHSPYKVFAYPGNGYYPKEYFSTRAAWSILVDPDYTLFDNDQLKINLTRKSDGKKWEFTHGGKNKFSTYSGYGYMKAIVFTPEGLDYIKDGEIFTVSVSGLRDVYQNEYAINYQVKFFDLIKDRAFGRVVDEETGKPITGVKADFYQVKSDEYIFYKTLTTNSKGEFDFTGFPIGEYSVDFHKDGYYGGSLSFDIQDNRDRFDRNLGDIGLYPIKIPTPPVVNKVTDKSTIITGTAEAGTYIAVITDVGGYLGSTRTDDNGKFTFEIPQQKAGTKIEIHATNSDGNQSEPTVIYVQDATPPKAPIVNQLTELDTVIKGKTEANATVKVLKNKDVIGQGTANKSGEYSIKIPAQKSGTVLYVNATDKAGNTSGNTKVTVQAKSETTPKSKRLAGASRYHTAVKISEAGWKDNSTNTVILARGDSFPDALAGASLAKALNAPILLTGESLDNNTKSEIKRLGAKNIVILGGKSAVSDKVVKQLKDMKLNVKRVAGSGRYETAVSVANELKKSVSKIDTVVLAYGLDFPDALSVAPYAASKGYPILLTETNKLSKATKEFLAKNKNIKEIIIVGGDKVISSTIEKDLKKTYQVTRIAGSHRFETAAKMVDLYNKPTEAYIANGNSFADALTGSVLAAKNNAPLLLVETDKIPYVIQNVVDKKGIKGFTFLGGPSVISNGVMNGMTKK